MIREQSPEHTAVWERVVHASSIAHENELEDTIHNEQQRIQREIADNDVGDELDAIPQQG